MAKALPNKALVYIIFVSCLALTILAYTFLIMDWDKTYWFAILVFLVMIILAVL